ncbi:MAG: hypothetical protein MSA10_05660 [Paraprevotella sp.]|nr:hypothetical protein [Paraprevotella sp.]
MASTQQADNKAALLHPKGRSSEQTSSVHTGRAKETEKEMRFLDEMKSYRE